MSNRAREIVGQIALIICVAAILVSCSGPESKVLGKWVRADASAGKMGIEFLKGGALLLSQDGRSFAGTYKFTQSDQILVNVSGDLGNQTYIFTSVTVDADSLSFYMNGSGDRLKFVRADTTASGGPTPQSATTPSVATGDSLTSIPANSTATSIAANTEAAQAVARVGDSTISLAEFVNAAKFQRFELVQQYERIAQAIQFFSSDAQSVAYFQAQQQQVRTELNDPPTLGRQVLNNLVDDTLIRQEAARRQITVSSQEVEEAYRAAFGYYPNGTPTATITPSPAATEVPPTINPTVAAYLTARPMTSTEPIVSSTPSPAKTATATSAPSTPTPYTTQGFATAVSSFDSTLKQQIDLGDAFYRTLVESQLYEGKLQAVLAAGVPTEAYGVHARHILVADLVTGQTILANLAAGGDFVALARQYSIDTATKDNAGDLGWFEKGQLDPGIDTVAFTQTIGTYSDLIPSQSGTGLHIIQVLERGGHALSATTLSARRASALRDWLDEQRFATMPNRRLLVQIFDNWSSYVPNQPTLHAP